MRRAIIDIGTNSVRLLVAERPDGGEWKTVTKKVNSTRLGEGMANNKALSLAAKERTLAAVKTFADEARSAGISDLTAYGTAIFRDSPEGPEFAKAISETIKAPMHILTGKEEAFYSYIGAAGTSGALTAVVDIGGGSTEICMGFGTDIGFRISFPLGCVRCTGQFDVVGARGIGELKKHCFELFPQADEVASVKRWIFVGGTATSIAAMLQKLDVYDASRVQGFVLKHRLKIIHLLPGVKAITIILGMGSGNDLACSINNVDLIYFHKFRDLTQFIQIISCPGVLLQNIGNGLCIMKTFRSIFLTQPGKFFLILLQHLIHLLKDLIRRPLRPALLICYIQCHNANKDHTYQRKCDLIHVTPYGFL